jgi:hypothetical protein
VHRDMAVVGVTLQRIGVGLGPRTESVQSDETKAQLLTIVSRAPAGPPSQVGAQHAISAVARASRSACRAALMRSSSSHADSRCGTAVAVATDAVTMLDGASLGGRHLQGLRWTADLLGKSCAPGHPSMRAPAPTSSRWYAPPDRRAVPTTPASARPDLLEARQSPALRGPNSRL